MKKIFKNIAKKRGYRELPFPPGSFQEALDKHEKQLNIAREAGDRAREGDVNFNLGNAYKSHGDFRKAIECYEKSLTISRQAGDRAREGNVYCNLGNAHKSLGDFPKAIDCYEKSLNIARDTGDRAREGDVNFNLGVAYESHGKLPKAIECYRKSLNIYRQADDRAREGDVYFNLGKAYKSHGDFAKAIECYEKSLNIYRQAGDRAREGNVYFNLGNAYKSHGDFAKAIECYEKSLNIARNEGDRAREGNVYCNLGNAHQSLGDFRKAIECYEKSLNISRQGGDRTREGDVYFNLRNAYKSLGDFPKAIESDRKSLNNAREAGERAKQAKPFINLGHSYYSNDFPKAIKFHEKSLNIASEAGSWSGKSWPLALGDVSKAAEYQEGHLKIVKEVGCHTEEAAEGGTYNIHESEDKSLALRGNIVESLVPPSCDPKETLRMDQTNLEQPTPETTAKDSNQSDVVKLLRDITLAGATGPLLPGKLDICDIPVKKTRELTFNLTESEDKSLALPCNVVKSLVSPSCDPKQIVVKLKENLHLDQADLEKPSAETTRMIRCLAATAKDSNRIDVVKHLREIMPAGTTGPLLPGKLDICDIPLKNRRYLTIDLTVRDRWKVVADRLGLGGSEIQLLDERYPNPSEAILDIVARLYGMNVDGLYDVLTECGMPELADIL